jgi:hypothetical protein
MSVFEVVFNLVGLVLGLSLVEVLSGLAKVLRKIRRIRVGWWLVVAFWTLPVAAMAFKDWLWAARLSGEQRKENLVLGLIALGIGTLASWAGFRRHGDK